MTNEEKIFDLVTKMYSEMQEGFKAINERVDKMDSRLDDMDSRLDKMEKKIDSNHAEVIARLSRLEENQNAIKEFILNSDDTFKKSEEAYAFIQKFKEVFTK